MMMRPRPWNPERSQTRRSMTSEHESKRFAHLASQQICQTPQPPRAQVQARCFVSGGCAPCLMICPHSHGPLLSFRLTFAGFLYWGTATTSTSNRSRDLATGHAHTHTHAPHMHGILHIIMNNHCRHAVDRVSSAQAIHPHSPYTGMAFKPIRWHTGLKVERSPRT